MVFAANLNPILHTINTSNITIKLEHCQTLFATQQKRTFFGRPRSVHDFKSVHRNVQELSMKIPVDTSWTKDRFFLELSKKRPRTVRRAFGHFLDAQYCP